MGRYVYQCYYVKDNKIIKQLCVSGHEEFDYSDVLDRWIKIGGDIFNSYLVEFCMDAGSYIENFSDFIENPDDYIKTKDDDCRVYFSIKQYLKHNDLIAHFYGNSDYCTNCVKNRPCLKMLFENLEQYVDRETALDLIESLKLSDEEKCSCDPKNF